jgi:hypothetical protein
VHSSRRLAAECARTLEVMWLLGGLRPNYHTIADSRKDNAAALEVLEVLADAYVVALVVDKCVPGSVFEGDEEAFDFTEGTPDEVLATGAPVGWMRSPGRGKEFRGRGPLLQR